MLCFSTNLRTPNPLQSQDPCVPLFSSLPRTRVPGISDPPLSSNLVFLCISLYFGSDTIYISLFIFHDTPIIFLPGLGGLTVLPTDSFTTNSTLTFSSLRSRVFSWGSSSLMSSFPTTSSFVHGTSWLSWTLRTVISFSIPLGRLRPFHPSQTW